MNISIHIAFSCVDTKGPYVYAHLFVNCLSFTCLSRILTPRVHVSLHPRGINILHLPPFFFFFLSFSYKYIYHKLLSGSYNRAVPHTLLWTPILNLLQFCHTSVCLPRLQTAFTNNTAATVMTTGMDQAAGFRGEIEDTASLTLNASDTCDTGQQGTR